MFKIYSRKINKSFGFSLVEVVISMGFFSIIVFGSLQLFLVSSEAQSISHNEAVARHLQNEYFEKIKNIRRNNWNHLLSGRFSLITDINNDLLLEATTTGEVIRNYHRYLEIENAKRDSDGNLNDNGENEDPSTKKITITVSWTGQHSGSISEISYITRYFDNLAWLQTTYNDFSLGTTTNTNLIHHNNDPADPDGEITLGAGGKSNWCVPSLVEELDLPKQGVAKSVTAIEGHAFAGTGENASGESFAHISITNDDPPVAAVSGVFNGYKTNDVFGETNNGQTYGYIATDTNGKEIVILNITQIPYTEIGYFNADGVNDGTSVRVLNNIGYMTQGDMFRTFKLTDINGNPDRTGSRTQLGSVQLPGVGSKFSILTEGLNTYAYIPISGGSYEMQIVDVTNPANLLLKGKIDIDAATGRSEANQTGVDIYVNSVGNKAYLITSMVTNRPDFFILNITDKSNPSIISYLEDGVQKLAEYSTGAMNPKGIEVVPGSVAIIVGESGEEYQVIRIGTDKPAYCGGTDIDTGIFDSASILAANNIAYTYLVTGDASLEFKIIEGGPGGIFATNGYFESQTLDTNHPTAFNRFFTNIEVSPPVTSIKYKVAVKDALNFTCSDVPFSDLDFVGPSGDSTTFFEDVGAVPFNNNDSGFENPGQCFRFRTYLETADFTQTPTLYDFTINYSP